jgi:hypothetical protein
MQFPQRDLTQQYISTSYQDVVQRYADPTGSTTYLLDGLGYVIGGIPSSSIGNIILTQDQTASWAGTASYAVSSSITYVTSSVVSTISASWASQSLSSSYSDTALSASHAVEANHSDTSNYSTFAEITDTASLAILSNFTDFSYRADVSVSSSWASSSISASYAFNVLSSSYANIASLSLVSDVALLAETASLADDSNTSISSSWSSQSLSASWSSQQQNILVNSITASYISASNIVTLDPTAANQVATKNYVDSISPQGLDYYFRSASSDIPGYEQMLKLTSPLSASTSAIVVTSVSASQYFMEFVSPALNVQNISQGTINVHFHLYRVGGVAANTVHPEIYIRSASVEYIELPSPSSVPITTNVNDSFTVPVINTSSIAINLTDRLVCKFKCDNGTGTPDMHMIVDGGTAAGVTIPVPSSTFVLRTGDTMTGGLTAPSFTGSLYGTSSNSISASWAPGGGSSVSASWASSSLSASYLNPGANIYLSQSYILSVTSSFTPPYKAAEMWWDDSTKTYAMYSDVPNLPLEIGQETWIRAYAGEYIPNGSSVYSTGSIGNVPIVKLALADGVNNSQKSAVIGLAPQAINSGSIGVITTLGLIYNLDTSMFVPGQQVYLSNTTSGSIVPFPLPDPAQTVGVGYVVAANSGSGIVQVYVSNLGQRPYPFVGMTNVPSITFLNSSSFIVGTGSVNLCTTSDGTGFVRNYPLQSSSFNFDTSSFLNAGYIVVTYNSGSPIYQLTYDRTVVDSIQTTYVYTITNGASNTPSYVSYDNPGILLANKLLTQVGWTQGIQRGNGLNLSESGSKYISITSGSVWMGASQIILPAVNSSTSRTILVAHSASVWSGSLITQMTSTQCDDGTNIVALGSGTNHYVVNYIYRGVGNNNATIVMYSPDYGSLLAAQQSQPPTPPQHLIDIAILVGRAIYHKGDATATQVDSAFVQNFSPSGITYHNDLSGLQGGQSGEYYHLTSASYTSLSSGTASYAVSASFSDTSSNAYNAVNIQTNETNTGIWYPVFVQTNTGVQSVYTDQNNGISYDMSDFTLNVSNIIGNLQGSATSASFSTNAISSSHATTSSYADNTINRYAGVISNIIVTNNNNGTITISTGSVNLYPDSTGTGVVTQYSLPQTTLGLIPGYTNFIVTSHSGSGAQYELSLNPYYIDNLSVCAVSLLNVDFNGITWDIHQLNTGISGLAVANNLQYKDITLHEFERQAGFTLFTTGSDFGITAGSVWFGPNQHFISQFQSSQTASCTTYHYINSSSNWTYSTGYGYDNLHYNGIGGLTALTPNSWSVNFIYTLVCDNKTDAVIVLGSQQYPTLVEAQTSAQPPANIPTTLQAIGLLVGSIVVQSGSTSPTVQSAYNTIFAPATVTQHNSLLGLQGGQGGEYYHLTKDEYTGTGTGVFVRANKPQFVGATPYHIPYWAPDQSLTLTGSVQVYGGQYVLINSGSPTPTNPEALLVFQINTSSVNCIGAYGTVNNYFQIYNQNFSNNQSASTDIVATADIGSQTTHYIDLGIGSSNYNDGDWPWVKPLDGYIQMAGGDLWLSTNTNNSIRFLISNSFQMAYFDASGLTLLTGSLIGTASNAISASWAPSSGGPSNSASWASASISSSYASTASFLIGSINSATYATSASWASQSLFNVSSSWASSSLFTTSASFASRSLFTTSSSYASASTVSVSSSWASASVSASFLNGNATASVWGTASWASNVISASYASISSVSISSSWASSSVSASFLNGNSTGSVFGTASWASNISSSGITGNVTALSASYASASTVAFSASYASASTITFSSSYASSSTSASFLNGSHTGSTWGTASWANNIISSSYASASTVAFSASYASSSNTSVSSSWASASISSSYASVSSVATSASYASSSTVAFSSSFASASISASFLNGFHTGSTWGTASWANNLNGTASWASNLAGTASWANNLAGTASWSTNAISSSFLNGSHTGSTWGTASWASNISSSGITGTIISSSYAGTSSFLSGNATASLWGTASWASNISSSGITGTIISSSYAGTSSLLLGSVQSATYATSASWASASLSSSIAATSNNTIYNFNLSTGSSGYQSIYIDTDLTYNPSTTQMSGSGFGITASFFGTSSWATNVISSSYAVSASFAPSTPSSYAISASWASQSFWAVSSSWASASISSSFLNGPATGSVWGTASWASNALTSNTASFCNGSVTGSVWGTASWASNALTSSIQSFYVTASNANWYLTFVATNTGSTAEYTTSSLYVNPSSGSLTATILSSSQFTGPVWTGYNVKQFGATGNNSTDDTAAIQLAISYSLAAPNPSTRSVDLFFPPGIYKVSAPISMSGNNVALIGSGIGSTVILNTATTGDILQIGNNTAGSTNVIELRHMQIYGNSARTSGSSININQANNVFIYDVGITNYYYGILIQNSSSVVRVDQGFINSGNPGSGSAIRVVNGPTGDTYISNLVFSNTPTTKPMNGIEIVQTGFTSLFKLDVAAFNYGLVIDPLANNDVSFIFCDHCLFDACGLAALLINPAGSTTARARSMIFQDAWFSGTTGTQTVNPSTNTAGFQSYGIVISGSNTGIIDDVKFTDCRILNNYCDGIKWLYSGANNILWSNCTVAGNSQSSSGVYNGFDICQNASNWMIEGCTIGTAGTATNTQKYAINFPSSSASSSFEIKGNNVSSNNTAPYLNIGPITGSPIIANNIGDASNGIADAALAGTVATSTANETLLFNCKIPANSVRIGQNFRILGVGTNSSTGSILFRIRVGANGTTSDNLAWTSVTSSAATVTNTRAGFSLIGTVRSLTTFNCDGMAYYSSSMINSTLAPAVATIAASSPWFIDITAQTNTGSFTLQECAIEAL